MMTVDRPPVTVFDRATTVLQAAAQLLLAKGAGAAFTQSFDSAPEDDSVRAEVGRERLDRTAARRVLRSRVQDGFVGLSGFSCFEEQPPRLYVEVFDTRDPHAAPGKAMSLALSAPIKKTWTGKYRLAGRSAEIHGEADPLE
jgi:hypothetical protein